MVYFMLIGVPKFVFLAIGVVVHVALMASVFIIPLPSVNNVYTLYLRRTRMEARPSPSLSWFCQITLEPRLYSGSRGYWAEADDIGYVCLSEEGLRFQGDHIECSIPWSEMRAVRKKGVGWRHGAGLIKCVAFDTDAFDGYQSIAFSERSSLFLPSHRRITKEMFAALERGMEEASKDVTPPSTPEDAP